MNYRIFLLSFAALLPTTLCAQSPSLVSGYNVQLETHHEATFHPLGDGHVVATGLSRLNGNSIPSMAKFDANGSLAGTIDNSNPSFLPRIIDAISLPGDQVLVGFESSPFSSLAKILADGSLDPTYSPNLGSSPSISDLEPVEGGKILVSGRFRETGQPTKAVLRLLPNGEIDPTFTGEFEFGVQFVRQDGPGHYLIGGSITLPGGIYGVKMLRCDLSGNLDSNFDSSEIPNSYQRADGAFVTNKISEAYRTPSGKILFLDVGGIGRLEAEGSLDESFTRPTFDATIRNLYQSSDGSFYLDGDFTQLAGQPLQGTAKLSSEGLLEPTFSLPSQVKIGVLSDGSILIWGGFLSYQGQPRAGVAHIDSAGDLQPGFEGIFGQKGFPTQLESFSDGSVLMRGDFVRLLSGEISYSRDHLAKLTPEGLPDPGFAATFEGGSPGWATILADDKILVRLDGETSEWNRLNSDGTPDASFSSIVKEKLSGHNGQVHELEGGDLVYFRYVSNSEQLHVRISPSGVIEETTVEGGSPAEQPQSNGNTYSLVSKIVNRYLADGQLDPTFRLSLGTRDYETMEVLPGRQFLVGGDEGTDQLVMIDVNGNRNPNFDAGIGANRQISRIWSYPEDQLIFIGGLFSTFQGEARSSFAQVRLNGEIESQFDIGAGLYSAPLCLAKLPNGKILIGGYLWEIDGQDLAGLAMIQPVAQASSPAPNAPFQVSAAAASGTTSTLTWKLPVDAQGVLIERQSLPGGAWKLVASLPADSTSYQDSIFPGEEYSYRLTAFNPSGETSTLIGLTSPSRTDLAGSLDPTEISLLKVSQIDRAYQLANGQFIVAGRFDWAEGHGPLNNSIRSVVRLNQDGSYDPTFDGTAVSRSSVRAIIEQPDGKILLGYSTHENAHVVRILPDGGLDPTFQTVDLKNGTANTSTVTASEIQFLDNGNILVGGSFNIQIPQEELAPFRTHIAILDPNGIPIASPFADGQNPIGGGVNKILPLGDGSFLVGTSTSLLRFNADGTYDENFQLDGSIRGSGTEVSGIHLFPTGEILLAGSFNGWLAIPEPGQPWITAPLGNLVVINADGTLNSGITANLGTGTDGEVIGVGSLASGEAFLAGEFTTINGQPRNHLAIIQTDGSLSSTTIPISDDPIFRSVLTMDSGDVLPVGLFTSIGGIQRPGLAIFSNASVQIDATFHPSIYQGRYNDRSALSLDSVNRLVVGGQFDGLGVNGQFHHRKNLARFLADGTLDPGFAPSAIVGSVYTLAHTASDELLVGGSFRTDPNGPLVNLAQLTTTGNLDTNFGAFAKPRHDVNDLKLDETGRIYLAGDFSQVGTTGARRVARILATGELDSSFSVVPAAGERAAEALTLFQDQLYVVNAENELNVYNLNGSLDAEMTSNFTQEITALRAVNDQALVIGHDFSDGLLPNQGALTSWQPSSPEAPQWRSPLTRPSLVHAISQQAGPLFVAGDLVIDGRETQIASFDPETGYRPDFLAGSSDGEINDVARWNDKLFVVGKFSNWDGELRFGVAILNISANSQALSAPLILTATSSSHATFIRWNGHQNDTSYRIEGKAPNIDNWVQLGVAGGQETDILLDQGNDSGNWVFRVIALNSVGGESSPSPEFTSTPQSFEIWKSDLELGPEIENDNDDDGDGIPLLLEYAFNLDPTENSLLSMPNLRDSTLIFDSPTLPRPDIIYSVENSNNMETWNKNFFEQPNVSTQRSEPLSLPNSLAKKQFFKLNCWLRTPSL